MRAAFRQRPELTTKLIFVPIRRAERAWGFCRMTVPPARADLEYRIWPTEQLAPRILRRAS
jgi:hypothetical protein